MKNSKRIIIIFTFLVGFFVVVFSKNLDAISKQERDSLLILTAKDVVLKYGPGYYRDYKLPTIKRGQNPPKGVQNPTGKDANRGYYDVVFHYDTNKELLEYDYAYWVKIWSDTGKPSIVVFGNGMAKIIPEVDLRSGKTVNQVPYQQVDEWQRKHIKRSLKKENDREGAE